MARTKGAIGKMNANIKRALETVFTEVNKDNAFLLDLAQNEKALFVSLISKCIPATIALDVQISLDLGAAMIKNQLNLDRLRVIEGNVIATDDNPINELPAKSLKTKDSTQ
jgi:hypothetical protein